MISREVVRHPLAEWVTDSLGESRSKTFGDDVPLTAWKIAPGSSIEPGPDTDTSVDTSLTLYFRTPVTSSAHDEWTVDGRRWEQVGESAPWPKGTVITLTRRTG